VEVQCSPEGRTWELAEARCPLEASGGEIVMAAGPAGVSLRVCLLVSLGLLLRAAFTARQFLTMAKGVDRPRWE
jgi:hypothetical protein